MPAPHRIETLRWVGDTDGHLVLIDQTLLPVEFKEVACRDVETVWEAIRSLRVRGAPAIGIAAAYGICLGLQAVQDAGEGGFFDRLGEVRDYLASSRPTAVNLFWALDRMVAKAQQLRADHPPRAILDALVAEARAIHDEDRAMCHAIGRFGAALIDDGSGILTHCNAGGLATSEYGTALAVVFTLQDQGRSIHVYVDETRPLLQGARLTAWELAQRGVPATLICDSMAAVVMREGRIQAVITGADRIAVLAQAHRIPFYVAAPTNTFDLSIPSGDRIPIEQRPREEITHGFGRQIAPNGIDVYNPAFDVTPAHYIKAIITERGVISPVTLANVRAMVGEAPSPGSGDAHAPRR